MAKKVDLLYFIVIVLLESELLIIVLELNWYQKARIGETRYKLGCP
jgi:hypothetical protein